MIVRILHEGQYELEGEALAELDALDHELLRTVDGGDEAAFHRLVEEVLSLVRRAGRPLAPDEVKPSALVLPSPDQGLAEVRRLLHEELGGDGTGGS